MRRIYMPNADEVAAMTVALVKRASQERGKDISRFRLARSSVRRMALRDQLRDAFAEEWAVALRVSYRWIACAYRDEFLLVRAETTEGWTKLGTARLDDVIKPLRRGDRGPLDSLEAEVEGSASDDDDED